MKQGPYFENLYTEEKSVQNSEKKDKIIEFNRKKGIQSYNEYLSHYNETNLFNLNNNIKTNSLKIHNKSLKDKFKALVLYEILEQDLKVGEVLLLTI